MEQKRSIGTTTRAEVIEISAVVLTLILGGLVLPLLFRAAGGTWSANGQFVVGPMVNCALIYAGVRFRGSVKTLAIICLPSALALGGGLLFALGSVYTLLMIPIIWVGNAAIVLFYKHLYAKKRANYITTSIVAIAVKVAIIFSGFLLLCAVGAIPAKTATVMSSAMGVFQIITAAAGAITAFAALKLRGNYGRN